MSLMASYQSFAQAVDTFVNGQTSGDSVLTRARAIDARLDELGADSHFTEKAVHEGY